MLVSSFQVAIGFPDSTFLRQRDALYILSTALSPGKVCAKTPFIPMKENATETEQTTQKPLQQQGVNTKDSHGLLGGD